MELLFIYNENSSALSRVIGFAHKVLRPSTYKCVLCNLTHTNLGERLMWKAFKVRSNIPLSFYYSNKFKENFEHDFEFPAILVKRNDSLELFVDKAKLNSFNDVEELITHLENKLGIEE